ncbi:MAG: peptidylprolyl isomerase [Acidimicrobiales bacterium]|nr:peptidylprolyl isomerase [Acidimicrobiales bacterium]
MSTDKRARQKENRANRVAAAEARVRSRFITYGGLAAVIIAAIVGIVLLSGDDDPETVDPGGQPDPSTPLIESTTTTEPPLPGVSAPPAGITLDGDTPCPAADGSSERVTSFASAPPMCIDAAVTYTAVVDTTYGEITMDLDASKAPTIANNFVVLARYGYYDDTPFHRIIPGFVIQGGDAVGSPLGTGDPGYSVADELPEEGEYIVGSVAMANSGPDTNGSQFFVITGDNGVGLPPLYSLFATVTEGLDVVLEIEGTETTFGDAPVDNIIINSVTITES